MALKSTIYKAELQIADIDRGYYADHALTLALHPSETEERLMVRLLAFALHADETLAFGGGLSNEDEADLWRRDLTGDIQLWIDVGQPDPKLLKKAHHRSRALLLLTYGRAAKVWWEQNRRELDKLERLRVLHLPDAQSQALAALAERGMRLQCNVHDGAVWMQSAEGSVEIQLEEWKKAA